MRGVARSTRRRPWLIVLLCVWPSLAPRVAKADTGDGEKYLVVRYDDYAPVATYPRMSPGVELESRLFELFSRYQAKVVAGVVPFPISGGTTTEPGRANAAVDWLSRQDEPRVRLLKHYVANGAVEPALHGFQHRRNTPDKHRPGEFIGRPYDWQFEKIRLGRDALAAAVGAPVRVFIPPWNAWDDDTCRALKALDFTCLSPDLHHAGLRAGGVHTVPQCTADPKAALDWITSYESAPAGTIIVLVTHPFDFEGDLGPGYFEALERLLAFVAASPQWACVGLTDLPKEDETEWHRRFSLGVTWEHAQALLGDCWGSCWLYQARPTLYMPASWYQEHVLPLQIAVAAALIFPVVVAWLVSRTAVRWLGRRGRLRRLRFAAALASIAVLLVWVLGAVDIVSRGFVIRGVRWQAIGATAGLVLGLVTTRSGERRGRTERGTTDVDGATTP